MALHPGNQGLPQVGRACRRTVLAGARSIKGCPSERAGTSTKIANSMGAEMPPLGIFLPVFVAPQSRRDTKGPKEPGPMASLFEAEINGTCNCFWDEEGFRIPFQEPPGSSLAPRTPGMVRAFSKDKGTKEVPGIPPHPTIPSSLVSFPLHASFLQPLRGLLPQVSSLLRGLPALSFILRGLCWTALPKGGCLHQSLLSCPYGGTSDVQDGKLRWLCPNVPPTPGTDLKAKAQRVWALAGGKARGPESWPLPTLFLQVDL